MDIVRVQHHMRGLRIVLPKEIARHLKIDGGEYLVYSITARGFCELRKVPSAKQLATLDKAMP